MKKAFVISDNIFSPLGKTTVENFSSLSKGVSGIKVHADKTMSNEQFYASLFGNKDEVLSSDELSSFTTFEKIIILSIEDALKNSGITLNNNKTILIISTTKGNTGMLENDLKDPGRFSISSSVEKISEYLGCINHPVIISNACISGIVALIVAKRLIQSGEYENAVVAGADIISRFILSGFESFQALSPGPCAPFDAERKGLNLGEGAATIILSSDEKLSKSGIYLSGGSITNDANHISGPSRTGEELSHAISKSLKEAGLLPGNIDFISAHGTATIYNDEMEAKAFSLSDVIASPVNSLKGYFGHTLGAAGIIESAIAIHSMKTGTIIPVKGFNKNGVSIPVNIFTELKQNVELKNVLKTGSGFGGCNAAIVFSKN